MLHVAQFLCLLCFIVLNVNWDMADSTRKTLADMEMSLSFFNEKFELVDSFIDRYNN